MPEGLATAHLRRSIDVLLFVKRDFSFQDACGLS